MLQSKQASETSNPGLQLAVFELFEILLHICGPPRLSPYWKEPLTWRTSAYSMVPGMRRAPRMWASSSGLRSQGMANPTESTILSWKHSLPLEADFQKFQQSVSDLSQSWGKKGGSWDSRWSPLPCKITMGKEYNTRGSLPVYQIWRQWHRYNGGEHTKLYLKRQGTLFHANDRWWKEKNISCNWMSSG